MLTVQAPTWMLARTDAVFSLILLLFASPSLARTSVPRAALNSEDPPYFPLGFWRVGMKMAFIGRAPNATDGTESLGRRPDFLQSLSPLGLFLGALRGALSARSGFVSWETSEGPYLHSVGLLCIHIGTRTLWGSELLRCVKNCSNCGNDTQVTRHQISFAN